MTRPIIFDPCAAPGAPSYYASAFILYASGVEPTNCNTAQTADALTNVFGALQPVSATNGSTATGYSTAGWPKLTAGQADEIYTFYC